MNTKYDKIYSNVVPRPLIIDTTVDFKKNYFLYPKENKSENNMGTNTQEN